jgi:hypothetical protein
MVVFVVLIVVVAVSVLTLRPNRHAGDAPAWIVVAATNHLPELRREWGRAMAAELTAIPGRAGRWRFAVGVLRVALFPPVRRRSRVLAVAGIGLAAAVALEVLAVNTVPNIAVFAGALGPLLAAYATLLAARSAQPSWAAAYAVVVGLGALGVLAAIAAVVRVAASHPAATTDPTHVYSIVLAVILVGYLAVAFAPRRRLRTLWWVVGAAAGFGAVSIGFALTAPVGPMGVGPEPALPVASVAVVIAAVGVGLTTHDRAAAVRAGLLTVALTAPAHVATDLLALLRVHQFTLTDPYDIAAYPHSGFPDVASYLLSDAISGEIISGLVLRPVILGLVAMVAATAATARSRIAAVP